MPNRRKSEVAVNTALSSNPKRYRCCWTDIRRSQWRLAWDSVGPAVSGRVRSVLLLGQKRSYHGWRFVSLRC